MGPAGRWVGLAIAALVVSGCGAAARIAPADASGDGSSPVATTTSASQRLVAGGDPASPSYSPEVGTLVSDVTLSVPALTRCTHEAGVPPG